MNQPLRWRDDPAFLHSTGIDVSAETGTLPSPDLAALRARALQAIASGALPTAVGLYSLRALLLAAAGSAVVGGVVGAGVVSAWREAPVVNTAAAAAAPVTVVAVDAGAVAVESKPPSPPAAPLPAPTAKAPTPPPEGSLAEELKLYQRAQAALDRKNAAAAVADFEEVLRRFPEGVLRQEAELGLTQALVRAGRHERALRQVDGLLEKNGASASRRSELLRLRAGALVALGRCDEARATLRSAGMDEAEAAGCGSP